MNELRLWGDPFGDVAHSQALRGLLRLAIGSGMRCALSLTPVRPRAATAGERSVPLHDGARTFTVGTMLPATELELVQRAVAQPVAATAPVVVFAERAELRDQTLLAGLEWPVACKVVTALADTSSRELLERVRAELRWAGTEDPEHGCELAELRPWLQLPPPPAGGPILHLGADDPAAGTELLVRVFAEQLAARGQRLRVLLTDAADGFEAALCARIAASVPGVDFAAWLEFVRGPLEPAQVRDCSGVALPFGSLQSPRLLVLLLASGRPLCCSRYDAVAAVLAPPGICLPIGGRWSPGENGAPRRFLPEPRALVQALAQIAEDPAVAAAIGVRARCHVLQELVCDRPAAPPMRPWSGGARPTVVLEAPLFENSSAAELTIATAEALLARGQVELRLCARVPFRTDVGHLRARAPALLPLLHRDPRDADLWLTTGWPPRAHRPPARTFAVRLDWEYGALPLELCPLVPQEADVVVVHGTHVFRTVTAAGRAADRIAVIPHGVDAALHEQAPPLAEVMAWKGARPAVLFVGGLVFRKGIDVFLRALLEVAAAAPPFCAVVKTVGGDQHYAGYQLTELVERFARNRSAPPLLLLDRELSRAELAGLYRASDLLLHPYRGEGFCLPVLEARACGLPVLVTAGGATDDFAAGHGVRRIPAQRRELQLPGAHCSRPWLLEPEAGATAAVLAEALRDLPALTAAARREAAAVRHCFSWQHAAAAIERLAFQALGQRRLPMSLRAPAVPVLQGR